MPKRTLDAFFTSKDPVKRARTEQITQLSHGSTEVSSQHETYPLAIPFLHPKLDSLLDFTPAKEGQAISNRPHLDLLYFQPYLSTDVAGPLFEFLRSQLFFYRVKYKIKRGTSDIEINTPRWTTVFGLDETSRFENGRVVDARTGVSRAHEYRCKPRPLPQCLDRLRVLTEASTDCKFNFALVNYYGSGDDSISYHSDDERFLGPDPAIASFSLGATRDFLLKHKPTPADDPSEKTALKFPLASGDMILMRGETQSNWLHSIPKRKGGESGKGRINITFRRAMVKGGTENYYNYNVGQGEAYKWDESSTEMKIHQPSPD